MVNRRPTGHPSRWISVALLVMNSVLLSLAGTRAED